MSEKECEWFVVKLMSVHSGNACGVHYLPHYTKHKLIQLELSIIYFENLWAKFWQNLSFCGFRLLKFCRYHVKFVSVVFPCVPVSSCPTEGHVQCLAAQRVMWSLAIECVPTSCPTELTCLCEALCVHSCVQLYNWYQLFNLVVGVTVWLLRQWAHRLCLYPTAGVGSPI